MADPWFPAGWGTAGCQGPLRLAAPFSCSGDDDLPLAGAAGSGRYLGALHAAACPAGELLGRRRGPAYQGADLAEQHVEQVMPDEHQLFVWRQGVEDDQQGESDRVG